MQIPFPTLEELSRQSTDRNPHAVLIVGLLLQYRATINAMGFDMDLPVLYERICSTAQNARDAGDNKPQLIIMASHGGEN